jgi:hypothetical protein
MQVPSNLQKRFRGICVVLIARSKWSMYYDLMELLNALSSRFLCLGRLPFYRFLVRLATMAQAYFLGLDRVVRSSKIEIGR